MAGERGRLISTFGWAGSVDAPRAGLTISVFGWDFDFANPTGGVVKLPTTLTLFLPNYTLTRRCGP